MHVLLVWSWRRQKNEKNPSRWSSDLLCSSLSEFSSCLRDYWSFFFFLIGMLIWLFWHQFVRKWQGGRGLLTGELPHSLGFLLECCMVVARRHLHLLWVPSLCIFFIHGHPNIFWLLWVFNYFLLHGKLIIDLDMECFYRIAFCYGDVTYH